MSTNKTVEFEQVVLRCCGLNVHKKEITATVDGGGITKKTRDGYIELRQPGYASSCLQIFTNENTNSNNNTTFLSRQ